MGPETPGNPAGSQISWGPTRATGSNDEEPSSVRGKFWESLRPQSLILIMKFSNPWRPVPDFLKFPESISCPLWQTFQGQGISLSYPWFPGSHLEICYFCTVTVDLTFAFYPRTWSPLLHSAEKCPWCSTLISAPLIVPSSLHQHNLRFIGYNCLSFQTPIDLSLHTALVQHCGGNPSVSDLPTVERLWSIQR